MLVIAQTENYHLNTSLKKSIKALVNNEFPFTTASYSPVKAFASSIATSKSTILFSVRKDNSGTEKNIRLREK